MASLLSVYHRLPPAARHLAATLRGYQLRHWRYGPETARLVEEAHEREHWPAAQWDAWRAERLARLLHRAATQVPYYRNLWAERRRRGDNRSWEDLNNWPLLGKDEVRREPASFVAEDCDPARMWPVHTSGSTGTPLRILQTRATVRAYYALFEARWRGWYGVSRHDRWAIVCGQLVAPAARRRPPFWVRNWGLRQLYLSSFHLAPEWIPYYVEAIRDFAPKYILGYSSSLYTLARECLRQGHDGLRFAVVLTNAEPLYEHQREAIAQAFQSPVRETYGLTEMITAASECEHGRLHAWPEIGMLEIQDADETGTGQLVGTSLINPDMPLIRFRTGDRGTPAEASGPCPCGRALPLLGRVEGRVDDVVVTPDGRRIGRLHQCFQTCPSVREAQIVQEETGAVTVLVVPDDFYSDSHQQLIESELRARLGSAIRIEIRRVAAIPRGPNGKFKAVVSRIAAQQAPRA